MDPEAPLRNTPGILLMQSGSPGRSKLAYGEAAWWGRVGRKGVVLIAFGTQESTAEGIVTMWAIQLHIPGTVVDNGCARPTRSSLQPYHPHILIPTAEAERLPDLRHPTANQWQRWYYGLNCVSSPPE